MRLTPKKIEQILTGILGEDGLPLIRELLNKSNISEFDLATRTKKDIKIIRRMLYTLYNHNLVEFNRKKDKIKGWYIYYWTLLPESIRFSHFKMKRDLIEKLTEQLERERRELFFVCPSKCVRLNFDQAMDLEFRCPECGELINQDNTEEKIRLLIERMAEAKKELEEYRTQRKVRKKEVQQKKVSKKKLKRTKEKEKKSIKKPKKII